ncbi:MULTISPECIES: fibronectin type III-like domain-contianing protein [Streptomyces]|uniref:fibronectin type III-like domain-contianing protein n=1 Tax=Streptomyces TaxID=1883 RepID=UPI001F08EA49|nr:MULTISPECIES: fibronectin type III-like domain-contianing protein [Streptomyces]MDX3525199.1 fibronectin type III-like domain-contianing protein [Streptomyces sp. ID05-39B]MDX3582122.1 fibronectin type III-like domain-contianing protein [Streptomyces europaeiscabiei]MDX3837446.1 fibronectin type III-like domain-contianing protein [Streptomyces europaeiscabiei]
MNVSSLVPVSSPARELRGFTKVTLAPGESTTVVIALDRRAFAYWDITRDDWTVAAGEYRVQFGENAHDVVASASLELAGDLLAKPLTLDSTVGEWFGHPTVGPALTDAMTAGMTEEQAAAAENEDAMRMVASMPVRQFLGFLPTPLPDEFLGQLMGMSRTPS